MQKSINRRALLVSGAFAGIGTAAARAVGLNLPSGPEPSAGSQGDGSTLTDGAERSLVAIPSSDPRFSQLVSEHFPAVLGDPTFEALKGVCVVLQNQQGPSIHAHKLRWTFTLDAGPFATELSSFRRPHPAKVSALNVCSRSANRPILKKGAIALISPFFALSSGKAPRQQSINWNKAIRRKALQGFLSQSLPTIRATSVSIQSVVYNDHTVLDTDNGKLARALTTKRNSEVHLAKAVLKKLNAGVPDAGLRGALKRTAYAARPAADRKQVPFHQARKQHAMYLHDVLHQKGRSKLLELVTKQAQHPMTQFRRLAPGQAA